MEWAVLGLSCAVVVVLQLVLFNNAGAFWRDEASTVLIASAPDWTTLWSWLSKDSAPVLMYALLRLWRMAGPEESDAWLRLFGTLVSLGMTASLLVTCRSLTGRVPLVAAALVVLNPTIFYFGSSLRAYGLAVLLVVGCCAAFWRVAQDPTRESVAVCALLAVLSCHASYQNSYLVLAVATAGALCCLTSRLWKRGLLVVAIGLLAAASLLVYSRVIARYQDVIEIVSFPMKLSTIGTRLTEAVAGGNGTLLFAWLSLFLCAMAVSIIRVVRRVRAGFEEPSLDLYLLTIVVVANTAGVVFFLTHGLYPNPWHYIPFLSLAAVAVEVALRPRSETGRAARARVLVAAAILAASIVPLWRTAQVRRTSMDRVSALLELRATPQDLILLNPYWLAPGFKYYFHGTAEWNTLPLTSSDLESSVFPFAPIKRVMTAPRGIQPTLDKIRSTLARGGRLWLVGGIEMLAPGAVPLELQPAPTSPYGWNSIVYWMSWTQQVGALLRDHALRQEFVPLELDQPVHTLENPPIIVFEGWRP